MKGEECMNLKKFIQKVFLSKTFQVELADENAYSCDRNFKFPTDDIIVDAIVKYADKNKENIEFISYSKPILFWLWDNKSSKNDREKFIAKLVKGSHPRHLGYYVMCSKVFE